MTPTPDDRRDDQTDDRLRGQADGVDPVLERRAAVGRLASAGQRLGYALFGVAMVVFFVGFATGFTGPIVTIEVVCLVAGSIVLAPAIVLSYGVKAADKEDRSEGERWR